MATDKKEPQELLANEIFLQIETRWDSGPQRSIFFSELRNKRIWGTKCPECGRIHAPPSTYCSACHGVEMNEWVRQADEGKLIDFSVVYYPFEHPTTGIAEKTPWAKCVVELDGGALFAHRLMPPDPEAHKLGDRYTVIWKEGARTGSYWDIKYFQKVE